MLLFLLGHLECTFLLQVLTPNKCFIVIITFNRNLDMTSGSLIPIGDDTFRANVSRTSPTPSVDSDIFDDLDADKDYSLPKKGIKIARRRTLYTDSPVAGPSGLHLKKRKRTRTPSPTSSDVSGVSEITSPTPATPKTPRARPSAKKTKRSTGDESTDSPTSRDAPRPLSNWVHAPGYVNNTKNLIYDYYIRTKDVDGNVTCKCIVILRLANDGTPLVCPHSCKQTRCSTSGPRAHLKGKHAEAHSEWESNSSKLAIKLREDADALALLKANAEGLTPGKPGLKSNKAESIVIKHNVRSVKQLEFDMRVTLLVANAGLPFAFVDSDAYKEFWAWKAPEYHLKCAQTLSKSKLPLLFRQVEEALFSRLKSELKHGSAIGFTADGWSSKANDKYIGVTCHIINKDWVMERYVVHCGPQEGRSKGDLIAAKFDKIVQKLRLPASTFKSMTTDNAANMLKAGRLSTETDLHMGCFDHLIQLIVNNALKQPLLCEAVTHFKSLVRKVHFGDGEDWIRKECFNLNSSGHGEPTTYCKLVGYTETRWNSCLRMMRSVLKMRMPLESLRDSGNSKTPAALMECIPSTEEFELVERLLPILTVFEEITDFMQSETYPAIGYVCSKLQWLRKKLCDSCTLARNGDDQPLLQFCVTACDELDRRFPSSGAKNLTYAKASLLNPSIKATVLYQTGMLHTTKNALLAEEDELYQRELEVDHLNDAVLEEEDLDEEAQYWRAQASEGSQMEGQLPTDRRPLRAELDLYLSTRMSIGKVKPHEILDWWKQRSDQFPQLCKVVKNIFSIQATSCAVERTFSTGGLTVTAKRTKLNPENVHKLVFIRENYPKLNITKLITSNAEEQELEKLLESYE